MSGVYSPLKFVISSTCPLSLHFRTWLPVCTHSPVSWPDRIMCASEASPASGVAFCPRPTCLAKQKRNYVVQPWEKIERENGILRKGNLNHLLQTTMFTAHKQGTLAKPVWDMSWKPGPEPGTEQGSSSAPVTSGNKKNNPSDAEKAKEKSVSCLFSIRDGKYMFGVCLPKKTSGVCVAGLELQSVEGNEGNVVRGVCVCVWFLNDHCGLLKNFCVCDVLSFVFCF